MLNIRLTGTPSINEDGLPLLLSGKAFSVLAFMLSHNGPVITRIAVATAVWPNLDEKRARGNLRREFHHIRSLHPLLTSMFTASRDHIYVTNSDDVSIDYWLFKQAQSKTLSTARDKDEHLQQVTHILQLLDATFLSGFYDPWIVKFRYEYQAMLVRYIDRQIDSLIKDNRFLEAERATSLQLSIDPLREKSYLNQMQLFVKSGNVSLALDTYRRCQVHLQSELGVEPNSELRQAYSKLKNVKNIRQDKSSLRMPMVRIENGVIERKELDGYRNASLISAFTG